MKPSRPPPASTDEGLNVALQAVLAVLLLGGLAFGGWYWSTQRAAEPMQVRVLLDNRCELFDDAFMAVSVPDGQRAYFLKGEAVLNTRSDARVMVRSSDRFPDFHIETGTFRAAPQVVITVRCGDRIDTTIESMREQFKGSQR
jgi:hypothetical protein